MKVFWTVMKVLAALAVIAGIVYVVATYGDKIVAWAKGLISRCKAECDIFCDDEDCEGCECCCGEVTEITAEENDFEG